jgi:hypothetical protein
MHRPINVKSPNNTSKWQMGFNSAFKGLRNDLKERRGYSHLKEEALDRTMWRADFGKGFGPVVRQTTK